MANTVAYNNGSNPVGSIKKGVVSINVDESLITAGLTWRNGIDFSGQYVIYSDTFTQGIDIQANAKPCAWSCDYNDTALLNLINSLPPLIGQAKYSTLATAIAWLEGQNKYFLVNQSYPQIVTSGCVLNVDAGMSGSYPNVGTTWYDISGSINNGALTNGPTWVSSGISSSFLFDGTDDYVDLGTSISNFTTQLTINFLGKIVGSPTDGILITKGEFDGTGTSNFGFQIGRNAGGNSLRLYAKESGQSYTTVDSDANIWNNNVGNYVITYNAGSVSFYKNGNLFSSHSFGLNSLPSTTGPLYIGHLKGYSFRYPGNIYNVSLYNRSLSQSEIQQNYYKGKIVTSGLTLALDAGNLVSYGGTSTTVYDLTSNANNGTLTNGPIFSLNRGGTFTFDGTDDRISLPNVAALRPSAFTATVWVNCNVADGNQKTIFSSYYEIPVAGFAFQLYAGSGSNNRVRFFVGNNNGSGAGTYQDYNGGLNVPINRWNHITVSYDGTSTMRIYVNGIADATASWTGGCVYNVTNNKVQVGSNIDVSQFPGSISNLQLYNRALSATEVVQNYNAYRNEFISTNVSAIGGTITFNTINGLRYKVHTFTSSGNFTVYTGGEIELLCVAGGGGGGRGRGGGGGAGGLIYKERYTVGSGDITVTLGTGGSGGTVNSQVAPSGGNSVFGTLTAIGGGGGAGSLAVGNSFLSGGTGGSGGGGSGNSPSPGFGGVGGNNTDTQGSKGGASYSDNISYTAAGGGGGAGGLGGSAVLNVAGAGGIGLQYSINGTNSFYAAGGGGGGDGSATPASGGSSVGGNGRNGAVGENATANTGSGGGGGGTLQNGGNGSNGIIIVRYLAN
jgi:hypothetical protein